MTALIISEKDIIVKAHRVGKNCLQVLCPFCHQHHYHGACGSDELGSGNGFRAPDCRASRSYYILDVQGQPNELKSPAEVERLRPRRHRKPPVVLRGMRSNAAWRGDVMTRGGSRYRMLSDIAHLLARAHLSLELISAWLRERDRSLFEDYYLPAAYVGENEKRGPKFAYRRDAAKRYRELAQKAIDDIQAEESDRE